MPRESTGQLFDEPEDDLAPPGYRRGPAGRPDAAQEPRGVRRPDGHRRRGLAPCAGPAAGDTAALLDPLGPAGHRQDDAGPPPRPPGRRPVHAALGRPLGRQGAARGDRRGAQDAPAGRPHDPLHRRDPPLQQVPARRPAPGRRGRHGHPDRGHDREPLVRGQRRAPVAGEGPHARSPVRSGARHHPPPGPRRSRARNRFIPPLDRP